MSELSSHTAEKTFLPTANGRAEARSNAAARAFGGRDASRLATVLPWLLLVGALVVATALLSVPLRAPIGAMYWDTFTYYDAANRILNGQIPSIDFFTPAGPLGYGLAAAWAALFPNGQPSLLIHWSIMTVTVPLMALALAGMPAASRPLGLWLVLPFLLFSLLPFNGKEFSPFPGSDGFGFYNRQTCLVLFPLVTGLVFTTRHNVLVALVALSMLVLFFLKITGFLAAGIICLFALLAGRLRLKDVILAAGLFAATLALLEITTGIVSGYIEDVLVLVGLNTDTLLPRIIQSLSINFGVVAALALLIVALLISERGELRLSLDELVRMPSLGGLAAILDRPAFWLAALLVAGVLFEAQNTASQAMIFVWPVLLWALLRLPPWAGSPRSIVAVSALAAAAYLPLVVMTSERAARAYVGAINSVPLEHAHLGTLGAVTVRPLVVDRSERMEEIYARHRPVYEEIASLGEMPGSNLYLDFDFQATYLRAVDRAIGSILALEAENGILFETIMSLNFTNPFPWLMDRQAPLAITIGADPFRAVPPPDAEVERAVATVDIALMPTCPPTPANAALLNLYAPALSSHRRITLDDCYDAFIHPRFASIDQ